MLLLLLLSSSARRAVAPVAVAAPAGTRAHGPPRRVARVAFKEGAAGVALVKRRGAESAQPVVSSVVGCLIEWEAFCRLPLRHGSKDFASQARLSKGASRRSKSKKAKIKGRKRLSRKMCHVKGFRESPFKEGTLFFFSESKVARWSDGGRLIRGRIQSVTSFGPMEGEVEP